MRRTLLGLFAAAAIAMASCAIPSHDAAVEPAPPAPASASAPLSTCAPTDMPPAGLASKPGYSQYIVTVTDDAGNPVRGLKQSDFVAYADNSRLPMSYFREHDGDAPESIVVVIDESWTMTQKLVIRDQARLKDVQQNIRDAVNQINRCDEIAVVAVGGYGVDEQPPDDEKRQHNVRVIQLPTTEHALALNKIGQQNTYGRTPLYDGVEKALELSEAAQYPSQMIVVISDGMQPGSGSRSDAVLARAERDGVAVNAIGMGDPQGKNVIPVYVGGMFVTGGGLGDGLNVKTLKVWSTATGGKVFVADDLSKDDGKQLVAAIQAVNAALGYGYSIGVIGTGEKTVAIALANPGTNRVSVRKEPIPATPQQTVTVAKQ